MVHLTYEELVEVLNLMFDNPPSNYKALNSMYNKVKRGVEIEGDKRRSWVFEDDQ